MPTRQPTEAERDRCLTFLRESQADGESTVEARSGLIHALFNHNEFISIR
jgi:hypothetical protein